MDLSLSTLIGTTAGCIGLYSLVPQVTKCCRTGDVAAISLRMFAVRIFGLVLWTVYGFALGSPPVLVFSALGLALSSIILFLKIRGIRSPSMKGSCEQEAQRSTSGAALPVSR